MKDFIFFRGQGRSGNHLLLNWILSYYENPYFVNNCFPFLDKPFDCSFVLDFMPKEDHDAVVFSLEPFHLMSDEQFGTIKKFAEKNFSNSYFPLLIRDPLNWYASYAMKDNSKRENVLKWVELHYDLLWKMFRSALKEYHLSDLGINFNTFVSSEDYRHSIAVKLDKRFDSVKDKEIMNTLWKPKDVNRPSSFDFESITAGEKQPKDMKVLERYLKVSFIFDTFPLPKDIMYDSAVLWPNLPLGSIIKFS